MSIIPIIDLSDTSGDAAIGDTIAFCPPMIITPEEIDELFDPVEAALDATEAWARVEGHLG